MPKTTATVTFHVFILQRHQKSETTRKSEEVMENKVTCFSARMNTTNLAELFGSMSFINKS